MVTARQISDELIRLHRLMELAGEDNFRAASYKRAGQELRKFEGTLDALVEQNQLESIDGVGPGIALTIAQFYHSGISDKGNALETEIPESVRDMLKIRGLGPSKLRTIWKKMGIEELGELYYACIENRLIEEKGFGLKTQENIVQAIEFIRANEQKFLYAYLYPAAEELLAALEETLEPPLHLSLTGDLRRKMPIADRIELLAGPEHYREIMLFFIRQESYELVTAASDLLEARIRDTNIPLYILFPGANYFYELFQSTSSPAHLSELSAEPTFFYSSEAEIYKRARIQYIEPELREGQGEVRAAYRNNLPTLVEEKDICGLIHAHSTWSDGRHSLREMALATRELGMEYLGISDHSQSAVYANGLSPERIQEQHKEIDALNQELAPFRILKGIESDILPNGNLDYSNLVLSSFDFVIASVHSGLQMSEEQATNRLLQAIKNPFTNILGHPTGRLLLAREGYPIDHPTVIKACAAYNVAIELNANPNRLDLDWRWVRYAQELGVLISINPDAHRVEALADFRWGVASARKGWLSAENTLNAQGLDDVLEIFMEKRKQRIQ